MAVLEGTLDIHRHDDGRVDILNEELPQRIRITPELLVAADPVVVRADGLKLTFAGRVVYQLVGVDGLSHSLLADLVEDRRGGG